MEINSARHIAFDYLDKLLRGIDNKQIVAMNDMGEDPRPEVSHLINQINDKYKLFGYITHNQKFTLTLNWEGTKVLDAGGIREYLLDNDTTIQFYQGLPKVFTVTDTDREIVEGKWMINTPEEYADFIDRYGEEPYRITSRATRRSGVHETPPPPPGPASTHLHVEGDGNTINAGSGNLHQNRLQVIRAVRVYLIPLVDQQNLENDRLQAGNGRRECPGLLV
jgi:hypothetical protein